MNAVISHSEEKYKKIYESTREYASFLFKYLSHNLKYDIFLRLLSDQLHYRKNPTMKHIHIFNIF